MNDAAVLPADREWLGLYDLNESIVGDSNRPSTGSRSRSWRVLAHFTYDLLWSRPLTPTACRPTPRSCFRRTPATASTSPAPWRRSCASTGSRPGWRWGSPPVTRSATGCLVTTNDAHAWVEAYFPGVGWVPFDPTRRDDGLPSSGAAPTQRPRAPRPRRVGGAGASPAPSGSARAGGRARAADRGGPAPRRRRRGRRARVALPWLLGTPRACSSRGRSAARCCAGAACSADPRTSGCARPSRCCTPTCATAASRCRPRGRSTRRRATCASGWAWTPATCWHASRRCCSEAGRRATRTSPTSRTSAGASGAGYGNVPAGRRPCSRSTASGRHTPDGGSRGRATASRTAP